MKLVTALLMTLLSLTAKSQSYGESNPQSGVAMGLGGGYSSKQCILGTLSVGAIFQTTYHASVNMVILSQLRNADIPTITEARIGHFFNTLEVYGGLGYHLAGADNKIRSNPNTGIRPALGVVKHFKSSPWTVSASMSGKIFSLQLGLFGVR